MRYIYPIFIAVFLFNGTAIYSQDVIKKVAADACKCIEALEADTVIIKSMSEVGSKCLYPAMKKNEQELAKEYNFDFSNEELAGKILDKVGNLLFTQCDAFGRVGSKVNQKTDFTFPPLKDSSRCKITREGRFQYMKDDGSIDTTVLIIRKGNEHIEYTENKKHYSIYKLDWVNECEYNLTFIKTNQESTIFKKGDSMNARIIYIEGNTIYMEVTFKTFIHKGAIIKIK